MGTETIDERDEFLYEDSIQRMKDSIDSTEENVRSEKVTPAPPNPPKQDNKQYMDNASDFTSHIIARFDKGLNLRGQKSTKSNHTSPKRTNFVNSNSQLKNESPELK